MASHAQQARRAKTWWIELLLIVFAPFSAWVIFIRYGDITTIVAPIIVIALARWLPRVGIPTHYQHWQWVGYGLLALWVVCNPVYLIVSAMT